MRPTPEILTIGHSTHPIERFLQLLAAAGVETIADVRRFPGSRRNPQFGAAAIADSLAAASISYESFGESLGGRRRAVAAPADSGTVPEPRPDNSAWRNPSFRAYADYMNESPFQAGLERLEELGRQRRTAIMCAEGHPSRCHRQLIADALLARGWPVLHLLGDGKITPHALSAHAATADARVFYPGPARLDL